MKWQVPQQSPVSLYIFKKAITENRNISKHLICNNIEKVMKKSKITLPVIFLLTLLLFPGISFSQSRGVQSITEKELRYHLEFLGAKEFRGRETPSSELEIATLYIGNWAKNAGLKPVFKDGSFYQDVPVIVKSVFQPNSKIRVKKGSGESIYYYGKGFGGIFSSGGSCSGDVVFAGLGVSDPEKGWDDLKDLDLNGKVVLILDELQPGSKYEIGVSLSGRLNSRVSVLRDRGAAAVFSIVSNEREEKLNKGLNIFENSPVGRMGVLFDSQKIKFPPFTTQQIAQTAAQPLVPIGQAEISHELASEILGVPKNEIEEMFRTIKRGEQVPSRAIPEVHVNFDIEIEQHESTPRNVIAIVEGSDPVLKNEYIVVSGHIDARGMSEGEAIAGADDNATAIVALMEIGRALLIERPKRSVILCWYTGEEQGMNGSHYFINNCPVPVEKISACLNMDMIGRNNPDSLYLVGSDLLSSGLDASIKKVNKSSGINFGFDYMYSNLTNPQRVYFRSDHYPFIRFGIPSVWFFCGFTPDYHTPNDILEFIDYPKFLKTTKLVYLTAYDIGNMKEMLKLDVNPAVTSRGKHNLTETSLFQNAGQ
jgi:hypothetical protein